MSSLMKGMASLPHTGQNDALVHFGAAQAIVDAGQGYTRLATVMYVLMSLALIVIGVGLLKRREWARKGALGWSGLGLVIVTAQCIAHFAWLAPKYERVRIAYYAAHNVAAPPQSSILGGVGVVFGLLIYAAFPIVMLALLGRRRAAADFTSS
jgi:hypothetical protein